MPSLIIGQSDPLVLWCLRPAIERARAIADAADLTEVGLVVGAPSADQWGEVRTLERFVLMLGAQRPDDLYLAAVVSSAEVICAPEPADLTSLADKPVPQLVTGLPRPEGAAPSVDKVDSRTKAIGRACASATPPIEHRKVAIVSGAGAGVAAEAVAAWQEGRAVVALCKGPVPRLLGAGGALIAKEALVALEAVELLTQASALRRALARRGRAAVAQMPSLETVSMALLEAMALAARGANRTTFSTVENVA